MTEKTSSSFLAWIDARFPLSHFWKHHLANYYAPKNLNFWYLFGSLSLLVLVNQIVTGIWLAMYYTPTAGEAFGSVESIMRNVQFGWLLRYMHTTGASLFFVVVYLHMYRGLLYGSYKRPRELLWFFGMVVYMLLLMEAFTGYVLPWGQMSYWATQVITSLVTAIPKVGHDLAMWIRGDYTVSGVTLHRFFSFHVILIPLLIMAFVVLHVIALHAVGSNNPDGIEIKAKRDEHNVPLDGIPFHPYFTIKDIFGVGLFLMVFSAIIFFTPTFGGYFIEPDNYVAANSMLTPEHIVPVWYMTPYYAILRAIPNKFLGVIAMGAAIAIMFVLPWLDRSPVRSIRYKGRWSKFFIMLFVVSFVALGYLGAQPVSHLSTLFSQFFTILYFAFFILMPFYTRREHTKIEPERVTKP